jgi:hypothetical protein
VLHDLVVFGMEAATHPELGNDRHAIQQHAVIRRGNLASRSTEKALEADHAGFGHTA